MSNGLLSLFPELEQQPRTFSTGVLPSQILKELVETGHITASTPISEDQIQPASLDLRLGPVVHRVLASFLPNKDSLVSRKLDLFKQYTFDISGKPCVLEKGSVYIVPLQEELRLPSDIRGKANPKSTTGRLDTFTRLIADYGTAFESVPLGYKGKLYAEIVPRTFSILVRQGDRLNQLRLMRGSPPPSDSRLAELDKREPIVYSGDERPLEPNIEEGLRLSVDLSGVNGSPIVAYRAVKHAPVVDIARIDHYDPFEFWECLKKPENRTIVLHPEEFYILASAERVRIPPDMAAEMVPFDPSIGEFRIHYAGFFDPGFGYGANDAKGTHAVLEVRSHEVPFLLEDRQPIGRLIFERLLAIPDKLYGREIGSSYQSQGLALSKQFKRMPS